MVYRIYVEKKPGFDVEAQGLKNELVSLLGIQSLSGLRLLNRYDVEGIDEALFNQCATTVFSEPPVDNTYAGAALNSRAFPLLWSTCPASSTSAPILPPSASSSSARASARWSALPVFYLLEGSLTEEQVGHSTSSTRWRPARLRWRPKLP